MKARLSNLAFFFIQNNIEPHHGSKRSLKPTEKKLHISTILKFLKISLLQLLLKPIYPGDFSRINSVKHGQIKTNPGAKLQGLKSLD